MNVVLAVSGGIAAYKAVTLARSLVKRGDLVKVVMTRSAANFVAPDLFREISLNHVMTDVFGNPDTAAHIKLANWADVMIVAPATANTLAKIACGLADDPLSTVALACAKPLILFPAMNSDMYLNAATQANLATLKARGLFVVEPDTGILACGTEGVGRLPDPDVIVYHVDKIMGAISSKPLKGQAILVTAGGTRENIDPVRFIGNRSSGKMGHAIAKVAALRGADVSLVTTSTLDVPGNLKEVVRVETAEQMRREVLSRFEGVNAVIMAAAVADYRVVKPSEHKIKKTENTLTLELVKNPDILLELGKLKQHQVLVGFAAETENAEVNAAEKLEKKGLDMIVANDVTAEGAGFGVDTNIVTLITRYKVKVCPKMSKVEVAGVVLSELERFLD